MTEIIIVRGFFFFFETMKKGTETLTSEIQQLKCYIF